MDPLDGTTNFAHGYPVFAVSIGLESAGERVLQRNIRLRNPYVDPLHLLQIDLLRRWRAGGRADRNNFV